MACGSENFSRCGPSHLTCSIDWNDEHHRRSVAASLVKGVYILERYRPQGSQSLASPWWEFFHFKLIDQLVKDDGFSIFGAIFEYEPPVHSHRRRESFGRSPRYVIALRGTLLSKPDDLKLNMKVIQNKLHEDTWYEKAKKSVRDKVASVGESNVWLTGHSLGAAMAMLVGKSMAKEGKYLETFLFNPPFISFPIERIVKDKNVGHVIGFAKDVIKAGLAAAAAKNVNGSDEDNWFGVISGWIPRLFVNKVDYICSGYINYFEHRKKMGEIGSGAAAISKIGSKYSLRGLFKAAVKGVEPTESLHLLPSANLTVNLNPDPGCRAHKLQQWWRPDLNLECSVYGYNTNE